MKGLKVAIVKSSKLGNSWSPYDHLRQDMKLGQWDQLKDIARRRRYHVDALAKLDDEEKAVREDIEK